MESNSEMVIENIGQIRTESTMVASDADDAMSVDTIISQIDRLTTNADQVTNEDRKRILEAFGKFKTATAIPHGEPDSPEFHWISTRLEAALEPILAEIRAFTPVTDEDMVDLLSLCGSRDMLKDAISGAAAKAQLADVFNPPTAPRGGLLF